MDRINGTSLYDDGRRHSVSVSGAVRCGARDCPVGRADDALDRPALLPGPSSAPGPLATLPHRPRGHENTPPAK